MPLNMMARRQWFWLTFVVFWLLTCASSLATTFVADGWAPRLIFGILTVVSIYGFLRSVDRHLIARREALGESA